MSRQISEERKSLYNVGLVLMILGGCLFALPFIAIPITIMIGGAEIVFIPGVFLGAFVGFGLIVAGGALRHVAARGKAGSGLVLDPEQARKDLEPWTRMGGGMVKDALDEAGIDQKKVGQRPAGDGGPEPQKVVMFKCTHCGKLNEEDSKFCQECGKAI